MVYRLVYGVQASVWCTGWCMVYRLVYGIQAGVWGLGWYMVYRLVYGQTHHANTSTYLHNTPAHTSDTPTFKVAVACLLVVFADVRLVLPTNSTGDLS